MTQPNADLNNLHQTSAFVELYTLDTTPLGGAVYRFTNYPDTNGAGLVYGGVTYSLLPIAGTEWDFTSSGAPPKPKLQVSNVNKTLLSAVISLGDLVGAEVTRIRTFAKYLDNGSSPDSNKYIGPERYVVEQKIQHNNQSITWQLSSPLDRFGMLLPRRQVLKDKGFPGVSRTRVA